MRRFGASKTALHFRKAKKKGEEDEDDPHRYRLEEGDGTSHAQLIVKELYHRYEKQLQRWKDYRSLFLFLAFVSLFLATLYLQRSAQTAYRVHSTIENEVVPQDDVMQGTDAVYSWMQNLLQDVWKDPVCGDGLCEAPFEFASYSRFGCRADCGKLSEIQNLTKVQVDMYYDFSHPVGSIPASDLMQQTSWNLCPLATAYSNDCYFQDDVTFDRLSGEQHYTIEDAPDGDWNLVVRRDIFNKLQGAVRDTTLVYAASYYSKLYIAAAAAKAEQDFELSLLNQAINITKQDYWTYANNVISTAYNASEWSYQSGWARNASCFCNGLSKNTTVGSGTWNASEILLMFNQSVDHVDNTVAWNMAYADFRADPYYCPALPAPYWRTNVTDAFGNVTLDITAVDQTNVADVASWCATGLNLTMTWRNNMTTTVQRLLIDQRLGDTRTTGKIAKRIAVNTNLRNYLTVNAPEQITPIYSSPAGTSAYLDPVSSKIDNLFDLYVNGYKYTVLGQQQKAALAMVRRAVYNTTIHLLTLRSRASARVDEVNDQQADARSIAVPYPIASYQNRTFFNSTVGALYDTYVAAGATNQSMPDSNSTALTIFQIGYNLVTWQGNTTAYMRADLPDRGPEYVGGCVAMTASCVPSTNDTVPYNCTNLASPFNETITGNLSLTSYREQCETPCDRKYDCNTICECYGTCGQFEYCECDACVALNENAASDTQFVDIRAIVQDQAAASASIADLGISGHRHRRRRQLLTTNEEIAAQLSDVLTQVATVSGTQGTIDTKMNNLKAQVDRANALAEARANDNRLIDLISAGRADIAAGQARVEAKLDDIIGKQNQALAAAEDAAASLKAIVGLSEKQVAAQKALESAVMNQLAAIKTATYQNIITLTQALALWKRARRDRALTLKAAKLANVPCVSTPKVDNTFTLDNGNIVDTSTSRERNIGLTNRVIGGMLLHQTRTNETLCPESKFDKIQKTCTGPATIASFGVDPVFKRGTTSYNADFDDVDGTQVIRFYNCSMLADPTYDINFLNQTVNPPPYCAELYNPQTLPYAFHFFPLEGKDDGFPVYFDINLAQADAQTWYTYVNEGLYLDQNTRSMTAEIVTYNAPLRIFGYFYIKFFFSDGGSIKVTHRLHTVRVELYNSSQDNVRFAMEIILSGCICIMLLGNLWAIIRTQIERKNFLKYFLSGWNWIETISNALLFVCMAIWWAFVTDYAKPFDMKVRYPAYQSLAPDANFLALDKDGLYLQEANADFYDLRNLIDMLNWYFALNGINILLLIARVLKLMDFQPRLGVVTRSLWLAGPDLIHFAIVAGMVFIGYAMMAHLIFGNAIQSFATFGDSVNTCFEILLGNINVNTELRALGGLQSVAGALFFWSYELLVFMVLLNFLLAIIVDAFSEVKERTNETVGIHTELYTLLRDKWRGLMGRCSSSYISDAKLGELLKQWAGENDKGIADGEAAEKARKQLTVMNEDMDEDTLREVLMECLKDAPNDTADEKAKKAGLLAACFGKKKTPEATSAEIAQAAHYIVDRFGAVPDKNEGAAGPEEAAQGEAMIMAGGGGSGGQKEVALEKERDQLAHALERLAEVQRELAEGQRSLMSGQKQLAEQQSKLVGLMNEQPPPE